MSAPPVHTVRVRDGDREIEVSGSAVFVRQVLDLDRLTTAIRTKTGAHLTRAEVIRALLDALDESRLDVTSVMSGAQLKGVLVQKLSA